MVFIGVHLGKVVPTRHLAEPQEQGLRVVVEIGILLGETDGFLHLWRGQQPPNIAGGQEVDARLGMDAVDNGPQQRLLVAVRQRVDAGGIRLRGRASTAAVFWPP